MRFSEAKRLNLRPQKERALSTFLLGLLVAAGFFLPYMFLSEGYFTFFGDFNVQQIPFYQMCHQAVRSGNISWNWLTDLGANFVGSYSFYLLGSPFFWLTLPFPNPWVPYLMGPLLILKFACAALTAYFYIRRFTKTPEAARIGGLLYAFSGFSVYNIFFNHFHEPLIFFPLLLLALELLLTENRRGVFALTVAVCAISNYFFFFGMVIFCILYFFVRVGSHTVKVRFGRFLVLLFEAVLGVGIAAFLLLPSVLAILGNGRVTEFLSGWNAILYGKEQIYLNILQCFFFPPDLPARPVFFPGAEVRWSSLGGWLPLFSTVGVFVLFRDKKGSWMKRLIGICLFMALVPILNSAFYAFNVSYYARWFYMPILVMCLATATLTEDSTVDWTGAWRWVFWITFVFSLVIGLFPQENDDGKWTFGLYMQSEDNTYLFRFLLTALIALVSLIALRLLLGLIERDRKAFYQIATAMVCVFSLIYANVFVVTGRSHSENIKDVVIDRLIEGQVTLEDGDGYRIDVYDGADNTGMYLGYPSVNAFHSVVPASIMDFYEYVGEERSVGSRPETDNPALRPLLSVKYLLNPTDGDSFVDPETNEPQMPGYEYLKTDGGYYVYENKNYIPYGFSYDYYMNESFCESYGEKYRAQVMLKALLLNDEQIKKYGSLMEDFETLKNESDEETGESPFLLSDETMAADCEKLAETAAYRFEIDRNGFVASVERQKPALVFFSVPYDEGWSATVNGKEVPIEKVNVGFMAVPVGSGTSTVVFTYRTPGLLLGLTVTVLSVAVFLIYFLISYFYVKNHAAETVYPEGEELLDRWREDDIAMARQEFDDDTLPSRRSILDDDPIEIPNPDPGFENGFRIDPTLFEHFDDPPASPKRKNFNVEFPDEDDGSEHKGKHSK